jgi:hypothetical protein
MTISLLKHLLDVNNEFRFTYVCQDSFDCIPVFAVDFQAEVFDSLLSIKRPRIKFK